jgi:hypothetical protein
MFLFLALLPAGLFTMAGDAQTSQIFGVKPRSTLAEWVHMIYFGGALGNSVFQTLLTEV